MQSNRKQNSCPISGLRTNRSFSQNKNSGATRLSLIVGLVIVGILVFILARPTPTGTMGSTFAVRQGNLPITVVESASIEALESQEIRSEVKGFEGTKILNIVEEGYLVTQDDVLKGKILVELDSSQLKQRIITQDIEFQAAIAALTEAQQAYGIQLNQNQSDIKAAEQKVRFARMDLEKYIGTAAASEIIGEIHLEISTTNAIPLPAIPKTAQASLPPILENKTNQGVIPFNTKSNLSLTPVPTHFPQIDFSKFAKIEILGNGEAKQKLRKFDDDLLLAKSEFGLSKNLFEGTQRLSEKGFVTRSTLENEQLNVKKNDLKVQTAETARDLFLLYEFPKAAEEFFSKYEEGFRMLDRTQKEAISKVTQTEAKLRSYESRYQIMDEQRKDLLEQLEKCTIKALKHGLVVYGGTGDNNNWNQEQIREGASIRQRQTIITIPDMTLMSAKSRIHESQIKKVKKGMKTLIRIDAFPDEKLEGEVLKVAVLPDSQNRWMNPELKVYVTSIKIEGTREWLKPGMSAKIEILADQLVDVVYCPIQAVSQVNSEHVVNLVKGSITEQRVVEIGQFNDEFIHIKKGLKEGDVVALRAPAVPKDSETEEKPEKKTAPMPVAARQGD